MERKRARARKRVGETAKPEPATGIFLELRRTHDRLMAETVVLLRNFGIGESPYNVLRILRGAGSDGLSCHEIGERMVTRVPDVTRILDRLEGAGWIARARSDRDRRVVHSVITASGRDLLARIDGPVRDLHRAQFASLREEERSELDRLLRTVREGRLGTGHGSTQ